MTAAATTPVTHPSQLPPEPGVSFPKYLPPSVEQPHPGLVGELVAMQRAGYPVQSRTTFTDAELRFQLRVSLARDEAERAEFEALPEDEQAELNEREWDEDRAEGWRDHLDMIGAGL